MTKKKGFWTVIIVVFALGLVGAIQAIFQGNFNNILVALICIVVVVLSVKKRQSLMSVEKESFERKVNAPAPTFEVNVSAVHSTSERVTEAPMEKSIAEVAEQKRAEQQQERDKGFQEFLESQRSLALNHSVVLTAPEYPLDKFPFKNRAYVTRIIMKEVQGTNEVIEESRMYYADDQALMMVIRDITSIENLLNGTKTEISLPVLRTHMEGLRAVNFLVSEDQLPQDSARMIISPLTPTGKDAKYPVQIYFHSYQHTSTSFDVGSHGELHYLKDGSIGKAVEHFWAKGIRYSVRYKLINGALGVGLVEYNDDPLKDSVVLHRG